MKQLILFLAITAALPAQQDTVFRRGIFSGITTAQASGTLPNIGQAVHIVTLMYPTAAADVGSFVFRVEASYDNTTYFPISEDITEAKYNGSMAYAVNRCNGVYPYVRVRLVTANASYPLTAHYTGSLQPIGIVKFVNDRYIAASPLDAPTMDGLCLLVSGNCIINGRRMTPIVPAAWTNVEVDTQTTRTNGTNSILLDVGLGASAKWNMLCRSLPSASNYHIRIHYLRLDGSTAGDNPGYSGAILRNSSTGAFIAWYQFIYDSWLIGKWSNPTTEGGGQYLNNPSRQPGPLFSVDITDNGTSRIWRWWDGLDTYRAYQGTAETQGRTDYTTPDQICVGARETNGNYRTQIRLVGYDVSPTW